MSDKLLKLPGFQALLFILFLALFDWPLLTIADQHQDQSIFYYLFISWGLLILLLFLIGRHAGKAPSRKPGN